MSKIFNKENWNILCDIREKTSIVSVVCCIILILHFMRILIPLAGIWCALYLLLCLVVGKGNIMQVKR